MTLEEFKQFVEGLDEYDREYIEPRLQAALDKIQVTHVIKLNTLYLRLTRRDPANLENPLLYHKLYNEMADWCVANCKGDFGAITVTNWGFELPSDAMRFKLTWDRSNYDDLALRPVCR